MTKWDDQIIKEDEPRERYDHNANNVTGSYPIDWENDLVPIEIWREQNRKIKKLQGENTDNWNWRQEVQRLFETPNGMNISIGRIRDIINHLIKRSDYSVFRVINDQGKIGWCYHFYGGFDIHWDDGSVLFNIADLSYIGVRKYIMNNDCLKNLNQTLIDMDGGECGFINIWRLGESDSKRYCTVGEWLSNPENQSGTWLIDPKWGTAIGPISVVWNDVNKNWELFSIKLNEHLYLRS